MLSCKCARRLKQRSSRRQRAMFNAAKQRIDNAAKKAAKNEEWHIRRKINRWLSSLEWQYQSALSRAGCEDNPELMAKKQASCFYLRKAKKLLPAGSNNLLKRNGSHCPTQKNQRLPSVSVTIYKGNRIARLANTTKDSGLRYGLHRIGWKWNGKNNHWCHVTPVS